jgi:predicted transcriptional regulator
MIIDRRKPLTPPARTWRTTLDRIARRIEAAQSAVSPYTGEDEARRIHEAIARAKAALLIAVRLADDLAAQQAARTIVRKGRP